MKKLMIVLALTLMITAGCTNQETPKEESLIDSNSTHTEEAEESTEHTTDEDSHAEESDDQGDSHAKEEHKETIIPQAELDNALSRKNALDIKASDSDMEEISLEPESESWEPRVLKQYTEDNELIKMTVTEPTDAGKMTGLTTFYYDQGELFFVESSFANYVFKEGHLIVWSDENYNVLEMSKADLERREEVLVEYLINYLEMFNVGDK